MVDIAMVVTATINSDASRESANSIVLFAVVEIMCKLLDTAVVHLNFGLNGKKT